MQVPQYSGGFLSTTASASGVDREVGMLLRPKAVYRSTWDGLITIARTSGWRALFAGLTINYMKVVPSTALGFTAYDFLKSYLHLKANL